MSETYDYIVVGGGTAGCVLANRLTASGRKSVLLIDGGGDGGGFVATMPAGSFLMMGNEKYDWSYQTEPDPTIHERALIWSGGKILGGSTAINGMVYVRGLKTDYDLWAESGAHGWDFNSVYPYFLSTENFHGEPHPNHGEGGPLSVSPSLTMHPLSASFLQACSQAGLPFREDYCGGEMDGCFYTLGTTREGRRWSAYQAYLEPVRRRKNLTIMTRQMVNRVVVEGGRASGVVVGSNDNETVYRANVEVILSAGTIATPPILMRSGIGPAEELASLNIELVQAAPEVGKNVQEHNGVTMSKFVNEPTYNTTAGPLSILAHMWRYLLSGRGQLTSIAVQAMAYARSSLATDGPDIVMSFLPLAIEFSGDKPSLHKLAGVNIGCHVARPRSRGQIRLRDVAPSSPPIIEHRLLDEDDVLVLREGLEKISEIYSTPALAAKVTGDINPSPMPGSKEGWEDYIRENASMGYHCVGSCRMGSDDRAVVDPRLRVKGILGLRVVDASVMPNIISGNTQAATYVIAERGAEFILEDNEQT